jgi:hypothetical protein
MVAEAQHTHQGPAQVEEYVFQDFGMLLRNYLLKGEPLNEIKYKN